LKAIEVLRKILNQAGIPVDMLYSSVDNESKMNKLVRLIASKVKKKMKSGEIQLSPDDKRILSMFFGRVVI